MKRKILIIVLVLFSQSLFAQERIKAVRVIKVNREFSFIVIDIGAIHGVTPGMEFLLIKDGAEVGKIEAVKVRDNVSACDIRELIEGVGVQENDVMTIYPVEEMFTPEELIAVDKEREVTSKEKERGKGSKREFYMPDEVKGRSLQEISWIDEIEGETISLDVLAGRDFTFYVLKEILGDHKIIVTHSNRMRGMLTAFKMMPMRWWEEIVADFKGFKEKKVVYSIIVRENGPSTSSLDVSVKYIVYDKKENPRAGVLKSGKQVREIYGILNKVKAKAEKIQTEWSD
ncbi:MAG: hypothetical protein P9M06_00635 [Candidatus Saelkia tenebricola]|nr:hypothetical protein [Candidatus Saelkia tenebricola]